MAELRIYFKALSPLPRTLLRYKNAISHLFSHLFDLNNQKIKNQILLSL